MIQQTATKKNKDMKARFNNEPEFISALSNSISFTREKYCKKANLSKKEIVDFDYFLSNIHEATWHNSGDLNDAIKMAEASFNFI